MKKIRRFKIGDRVKIIKIPKDLDDRAEIDTPGVFRRALGKIFRLAGFDDYGNLRLEVTKLDTIWIEPEFVSLVKKRRLKKGS